MSPTALIALLLSALAGAGGVIAALARKIDKIQESRIEEMGNRNDSLKRSLDGISKALDTVAETVEEIGNAINAEEE